MKNKSTFIALGGVLIICIFSFVSAKNLVNNDNNNQYYAKPNEEMTAKISAITKENGKIIITTINNPVEYCLKTTKSMPSKNSLCWNKIENNKIELSYIKYKTYYVWIKDTDGRVSERTIINND